MWGNLVRSKKGTVSSLEVYSQKVKSHRTILYCILSVVRKPTKKHQIHTNRKCFKNVSTKVLNKKY